MLLSKSQIASLYFLISFRTVPRLFDVNGDFRFDCQCLAEMFQRFIRPVHRFEDDAVVVKCGIRIRNQLQCGFEMGFGFLIFFYVGKYYPEQIERREMLRVLAQHLLKSLLCIVEISGLLNDAIARPKASSIEGAMIVC